MARDPVIIWGVTSSILLLLSVIAVVLRLYTGRLRGRSLRAPDYLICLSLLCQIGYVADISIGVYDGGVGHHLLELFMTTPEKIIPTLRVFWISQWFWATGIASFRLAILLLYMEVFSTGSFPWRAKATAGVVFAYWVACILTICLLCRPVSWNWDQSTPGTCGNITAIELFSGAFNMTVDIWVVYLPLPTIWKLQLTPQRKWALTAAFSLGLGTAGVNLGRLIQTIKCSSDDTTYCLLESTLLVTAEISGGILVACVPTLGPLLSRKKEASSTYGYNSQGQNPLVTFGSIPLRNSKGKGTTVDESRNDGEWTQLDDNNSETGLALRPETTEHQTNVSQAWHSRQDAPGANSRDGPMPPGGIMRKVEYGIDESRV